MLAIESYQAVTGQEGQHIDEFYLAVKCFFSQSKLLEIRDKESLKNRVLYHINQEERFCQLISNYEAEDIIQDIKRFIIPA